MKKTKLISYSKLVKSFEIHNFYLYLFILFILFIFYLYFIY
jgi:hypothetical protein